MKKRNEKDQLITDQAQKLKHYEEHISQLQRTTRDVVKALATRNLEFKVLELATANNFDPELVMEEMINEMAVKDRIIKSFTDKAIQQSKDNQGKL
mgnify:CR=1 FL=1